MCCVLGQDTSLLQCLSLLRCIYVSGKLNAGGNPRIDQQQTQGGGGGGGRGVELLVNQWKLHRHDGQESQMQDS